MSWLEKVNFIFWFLQDVAKSDPSKAQNAHKCIRLINDVVIVMRFKRRDEK